jgi:hypothetical protein
MGSNEVRWFHMQLSNRIHSVAIEAGDYLDRGFWLNTTGLLSRYVPFSIFLNQGIKSIPKKHVFLTYKRSPCIVGTRHNACLREYFYKCPST